MSDLVCRQNQLSCFHCKEEEKPAIEKMHFNRGEEWKGVIAESELIFVLEGAFVISYDRYLNLEIPAGTFFLLPSGCQYTAQPLADISVLVFRLREQVQFCERFSLEILNRKKTEIVNQENVLEIKEGLTGFLSTLETYISNGTHCPFFLQLKVKELLYLLGTFYSNYSLALCFRSLLSGNFGFSDFVLKNYHKTITVKELSELSSYSQAGFEKEFRRVFGMSASRWLREKKNNLLYHDLNTTEKTFKEIAFEYGFFSLSQFNDYCKKHFGLPPGKIRKRSSFEGINVLAETL
ncbi:AraC family transcriptional regulator [Parabacteroides sp. PF5-9]|uniref:AraC family transcriptional regulator n=1 Tax=Parabacteroides sp. PF5-9 TaxID=1742404 RepID=UPI0024741D2C|nr:AraC family transcriptional regulator [Parabacteroides sp. PF5-9]MDH6359156.1 AraC-like DNA-binding protein [Parabacteroides sp. PF5-9]